MIWKRTLIDIVYGADVTIVVGPIDEFRPWVETHYATEFADLRWDGTVAGRVLQHRAPTYTEWIVWFPPRVSLDTIAHESVHLAARVLRDRNLKLCDDSEEAYAYYLESLFRQLRQAVTDAAAARRRQRKLKGRKTRRRTR